MPYYEDGEVLANSRLPLVVIAVSQTSASGEIRHCRHSGA